MAGSVQELEFERAIQGAPAGSVVEVMAPWVERPVAVRVGSSDVKVFRQIFLLEELAFGLAEQPGTIIDAGANIGLASVYFASRYPQARLVALEIEEENFRLLERNTRHLPQVTAVRRALWSGPGTLRIKNPYKQEWAFQVSAEGEADAPTVEAIGVRELLDEFGMARVDLLKMDIEGAEKEVFEAGVDGWIDRVGAIAVELHHWFRPGCTAAAMAALAGRGFVVTKRGQYTVFRRGGK